jgi:hypothetical protein
MRSNLFWGLAATSAVVIVMGTYVVTKYTATHPGTVLPQPPSSISLPSIIQGNPILKANRETIRLWYGQCFTTLYAREEWSTPASQARCEERIISDIKQHTGIELNRNDFYKPDVISRLKQLFPGGSNSWWKY